MAPRQVPALLDDTWPPSPHELYAVMLVEHWRLEETAYEVLHGRASRERLDQAADRLAALAELLRKHEPGE